jgi:serine/threonine protein kinase
VTGGLDQRPARWTIVRELSQRAAPHVVTLARGGDGDAVVLKRLRDTHRDRDDLVLRLQLEADVLHELGGSHGIVRLLALDGDPLTLVMEYVGGGSLVDRLHDARSLGITVPVRRALCIAGALLDALDHLHANGVIHRDIKPSNVLFAHDGTVRLIDFGVAARSDPARAGACYGLPAPWIEERVGTLPYAAPESVLHAGGAATTAQDIYGLGVVLYEMLTGRPPWMRFDGESAESFAMRVTREESESVVGRTPGLDPRLAALLTRALHADPERRFASAGEFARALSVDAE